MGKLFKKIDTTGLLCLLSALHLFLEMRERFPDLKDDGALPWWGGIVVDLFFMLMYYVNYGKEWSKAWVAKFIKICTLFPTWGLLYDLFVTIDFVTIPKFMALGIAGAITMLLAAFCFNNAEGK